MQENQKANNHRDRVRSQREYDKMSAILILADTLREFMDKTPDMSKKLFCQKCSKTGSSRITVIKIHSDLMREQKNFMFMIDKDEQQKFMEELKRRVGIMIDTFTVDNQKVYLCVPCQIKIGLHSGETAGPSRYADPAI